MRHAIVNIICMFIWKKSVRDKVRTILYYPQVRDYNQFVRDYAHRHKMKNCKIKTKVGWICCNWVVILNDKHVFKFPLKSDGKDAAIREQRLTDALRKVSPIKIPQMETIIYKDIAVRRYEFAHGKLFSDLSRADVAKNAQHLSKQIANFLYVLGRADPREIADLKPSGAGKPGFLYGWNHGDIWQNFMVNPKTFDITFFIDWESANFGSMYPCLYSADYHWVRFGFRGLIVYIMAEYATMYFKKNSK